MAATELPGSTQEKPESPNAQAKTIFNILSKLKETEPSTLNKDVEDQTVLEIAEDNEDIVILRRDPNTNRNTINKTAYLKLHRSLSPNRNSTIEKIKEQYEKNDKESLPSSEVDSNKKSETLDTIKSKYSPAGLGYTKPQPAPRPRRSKLTRSQIIVPSKRDPVKNARLSLNIEKNKHKDVNSNELQSIKQNLSSDEEFISIVTRSDSEESIYKFQKELSAFTMDKKKRPNSFRKIFSVFSNKDKKKRQEDKNKLQNRENGETNSDNFHNESNNFSRQAPYRHTTGGDSKPLKSPTIPKVQKNDSDGKIRDQYIDEQLEKDYAQMHVNQFNKFKQNFDNASNQNLNAGNRVTHEGYTKMDKPIQKSPGENSTYMNLPAVRKYIDTSSSASTLESDRSNLYQNEVLSRSNQNNQDDVELRYYPSNSFRPSRITDGRRDTPPRLLETQQDVRLVNPKALIPINSERPLPNPYQNSSKESPVDSATRSYPLSRSTPTNPSKNDDVTLRRPYLEETYGTVLDSLEERHRAMKAQNKNSLSPIDYEKPPRSPSLEPSKLKLPPNRDIVPLSPRVRSPIPSENVSTEKMIATELLKPRRSPTPTKKGSKDASPSHQRLEIDIDYPDNVQYASKNSLLRSTDNLIYKPPVAAKPNVKKLSENSKIPNDNYKISQASPTYANNATLRQRISQASPVDSPDKVLTNAQVHINSPVNRTPTPNNSTQNLSLSPTRPHNIGIRPLTPSDSRIPESPKTTPQKEDIRKSVEAYYWKEIKKLKDQENQELYLLQMQYGNMFPFGYAEDPVSVRRSRSMSPSTARNGRRSLSLPRDTRPPINIISEKYYPNAIPENRAVTNQMQPRSVQQLQFQQQQYFNRNTPERKTVDGSNTRNYENNTNSLYRPIFKRGSLNTPPSQVADDSLKRKVSFTGAQDLNVQSWPTKNGFTQSPPQRRIDKIQSQGDDEVFLPITPKIVNDNRYRYPESNIRPELPSEETYYNTRQNIIGPNGEPVYIARNNQNALYLTQRQTLENPYGQRLNQSQRYLPNQSEEVLYGLPVDAVRPTAVKGLTRHGSIQINEEMYGQRPVPKRISYQNNSARPSVSSTPVPNQEVQYVARPSGTQQGVQPLRREIILNDEIFGQFGGYIGPNNSVRVIQNQNVYASRQSIAEYNSRVRDQYYNRPNQRQVSITNRVCDIYGQIHDSDPPKIQQSGTIMGQLNRSPGSPAVVRTSHSQLPVRDNFIRNSRLTASANDMYRRVQNTNPQYSKEILYGKIEPTQEQNGNMAPNRPLPPVPQGKKGTAKGAVRHNLVSDTESGSDASEVQRILNSSTKTKKRGIFGK